MSFYSEESFSSNFSKGSSNPSLTSSNAQSTIPSQENLRQAQFQDSIARSGSLRQVLYEVCENKFFSISILTIILMNTLVLAFQAVESLKVQYSWQFSFVDSIFLGIYMMEAIVKVYVWRLEFFRSGWNNFDLFIILSSLLSTLMPLLTSSTTSVNSEIFRLLRLFRAVRAVRTLRVLRTIKFLRSLQMVVSTLLKSLPAMGNICVLTLLVIYVFTIIGKTLFGDIDQKHFGSVFQTAWTLFQLTTLDNWSSIYLVNKDKMPGIFAYTFIYIILVTFVFINLFVAVIVDNMQTMQEQQNSVRRKRSRGKDEDEELYKVAVGSQASLSLPPPTKGDDEDPLGDLLLQELGVDNYYSANLPALAKELYARHFMLLASLERSIFLHQQQQKVLDDLVDLVGSKRSTSDRPESATGGMRKVKST